MRDPFVFDSRSEFCKSPYGAAPCGSDVVFHVRPLTRDGYSRCVLVARREFSGEEIQMELLPEAVDGERTRFTGVLTAPSEPELLWYHFRLIRSDGSTALLDQSGWQETGEIQSWQLTVYEKTATPLWFGGGVVYQIFPDRFCRLSLPDPTGLVGNRWVHENWNDQPVWAPDPDGEVRNRDFFGGSLNGITAKLDDLAALGVTVLYLNPIFESASNHRYNTADYLNVDPLLGTNEEFEVLCREAAKYGIGIVLDGVFSHTGSDSRYFNREGRYGEGGAYRDPNSPYRSWYDFDPKYKGGYRSWWGFETLPEVNEETPSFVEFITGEGGVIDTWLRRGAVGFRLDVADELPDEFIEKIRTAVKRVSPEKFLLGEVWEDATTKFGFDHRRTYLLGKGLDSVMNYPFKNSVLDFVKGKPAQQAANEILSICEHYPAPAINTALNFLSTHDTERALTVIADEPANGRGREWQSGRSVTGEAYEEGMLRLRMAYAIIYTLPGVPCLYYGDEIGMQGYRDPFNRAFFCWDSHEERLRPVLAQLAQLRHSCEAFRTGELRVLRAEDGILHYQRIGKTETAEIIVNRSEHIIVEPLASGKHTEVNPMGFTIVVEENGHNPNHSYYDIQ